MDQHVIKQQMDRLQVALAHLNKLHHMVTSGADLNAARNDVRAITERAYLSVNNARDRLTQGLVTSPVDLLEKWGGRHAPLRPSQSAVSIIDGEWASLNPLPKKDVLTFLMDLGYHEQEARNAICSTGVGKADQAA